MKSYLAEVHYPIILVLGTLMQDYSASLLLYKDGYYNIDDASKAKLPEQNLTTLKSDLEGSRNNLQNQLDLLSTEKAKINDILTYRGMSHTTTIMKYNALINDLNRLHQSIAQYESQHTMQDLVPFKELLASTKRLLASYGSQSRNVGSYQPGSIGQLQQMQEVAAAYSNAVNHLSNRTDRIRTAQERDAVRWEAIAAEERRNQGVLNFVVGALTVVGGVVAIVATAGAATPLVVAAGATLGTGTALYGYSNMIEAEQDIIYGSLGDTKSFAVNPIRDTIFLGNNQLYHQTGQIFSIGSSIIAPIGQTGSVVKGLAQFGGGALGAWGGGELGYHGAKLLGASDSQANAAKFLSSMAGASAGSSLAGKFSLNKLITKKVPEQENLSGIDELVERPSWRQSEVDVGKDFPGYEPQKSFLNGNEVPHGTKGSVRPEYYKAGHSIEVKNYNVQTSKGRSNLVNNVSKQVKQRTHNLPESTKQTVVIDVRGQNVDSNVLKQIRDNILSKSGLDVQILFKK